jgi:poly-gamma-glutamate synthesis protein (capsule biosynthesis protein)
MVVESDCGSNGEYCKTETPLVTSPIETNTPTATDDGIIKIFVDGAIQSSYRDQLTNLSSYKITDNPENADIVISIPSNNNPSNDEKLTHWLYVIAVPFNIPAIDMDLKTLDRAWNGIRFSTFHYQPLYISESTAAYFRSVWGEPNLHTIEVLPDQKFDQAIANRDAYWAIFPFEDVPPTWRILSVDGVYPLDRDLEWEQYALSATYSIEAKSNDMDVSPLQIQNIDLEKMSSVLLTGTTAFVRYLAYEMETRGMDYAIENVRDVFQSADIAHLSNEVPMFDGCPSAVPVRREMRFCSSPDYISLFKELNIRVVELSGNHELDWFAGPFLETLQLYKDNQLPYVGGGTDLKEALQPLEIQDHGNHFVFFSCNAVGPVEDLATEDQAGSAPCDFERMEFEITQYKQIGYIPIILLQHYEVDTVTPNSLQRIDFAALADAGAVIVSGSQAHNPQTYAIINQSLIHYGLGNMFFDQTYEPNSLAIMDKHYFYEGKYYNTQIIPIETSDQYQVKLMPNEKIASFLESILEPMP